MAEIIELVNGRDGRDGRDDVGGALVFIKCPYGGEVRWLV
jgi:hypothetical protein